MDESRATQESGLPSTKAPSKGASTEFSKPPELETYDGRSWGYRLGWWVVPRPEGPSDFCGIGHFGQFIYVSPRYRAVFVRDGPGRGNAPGFGPVAPFASDA